MAKKYNKKIKIVFQKKESNDQKKNNKQKSISIANRKDNSLYLDFGDDFGSGKG